MLQSGAAEKGMHVLSRPFLDPEIFTTAQIEKPFAG